MAGAITDPGTINVNRQRVAGPVSRAGREDAPIFFRVQCLSCEARYRAASAELMSLTCPYCQGQRSRSEVQ